MISLHKFFVISMAYLLLLSGTVQATELDVFRSQEPFSVASLFPELKRYNLDQIEKEKIPSVLKIYLQEEKKTRSLEEKNLFALAIGFLHWKNENYSAARNWFDKKIMGNFVLEDYRLHFWAGVLKDAGIKAFADNHYSQAVQLISHAVELTHELDRVFPDSPFHQTIQKDTALLEQLLGDIQFKRFNYKAAWQFYRRAMMRNYPGKELLYPQLALSIARTYEAGGEVEPALDMLINLLKKYPTPERQEEVETFVNKHRQELNDKGINPANLMPADSSRDHEAIKKTGESEIPSSHPEIRNFYDAAGKGGTLEVLEKGLEVLIRYPGLPETRDIMEHLDSAIIEHLGHNPWPVVVDSITRIYPPDKLSRLALVFWKKQESATAAKFYTKIIEQYPLETGFCHKSLFFLGRIYEDLKSYPEALGYYSRLINEYSDGPYTTASLFKIPWIMRLQGNFQQASENFDRLIRFYSSSAHGEIEARYPEKNGFLSAAYYWQAQTQDTMGHLEAKQEYLGKLVMKFPLDYYSIISRKDLNINLNEFLTQKLTQDIEYRYWGLGDIDRKHLSRAEKLTAIGFHDAAADQLLLISSSDEQPAFLFYLSRLLNEAGRYQESIATSWTIADRGKALSSGLTGVLFPPAFLGIAEETAREYKMDPLLVLSLMRQESAFNPRIISSANAVGLMQLMPATAAQIAKSLNMDSPDADQLKIPGTNIKLGTEYLSKLLALFDNNLVHALAAYNAGPSKIREWLELRSELSAREFIESIPYNETRGYVKNVLRNYAIYTTLYSDGDENPARETMRAINY